MESLDGNIEEYKVTTTRSVVLPPELVGAGNEDGRRSTDVMVRHSLGNDPLARCNDGTEAVYYY